MNAASILCGAAIAVGAVAVLVIFLRACIRADRRKGGPQLHVYNKSRWGIPENHASVRDYPKKRNS